MDGDFYAVTGDFASCTGTYYLLCDGTAWNDYSCTEPSGSSGWTSYSPSGDAWTGDAGNEEGDSGAPAEDSSNADAGSSTTDSGSADAGSEVAGSGSGNGDTGAGAAALFRDAPSDGSQMTTRS